MINKSQYFFQRPEKSKMKMRLNNKERKGRRKRKEKYWQMEKRQKSTKTEGKYIENKRTYVRGKNTL